MSYFKTVTVDTELNAITTNKGDIIVNDGTTNTSLVVGTDGYVLTADSTQTTGLKWAPSTGTANVSATQKDLTATISTNTTSPFEMTDFTFTPTSGTYLISANFTYAIDTTTESLTIGVYKNGTLIADSARVLTNAGSNIHATFTGQTLSSSSGSDVFSVKINSSSVTSAVHIYEGNVIYLKLSSCVVTSSSSTITTNSTSPFEIVDMTTTPPIGSYYIMCNYLYGMSKIDRTFTNGLYKNNSLISSTNRIISAFPQLREVFQVNFVTTFDGTQTFSLQVNVNNADTTLTIYNRSIFMIPLI